MATHTDYVPLCMEYVVIMLERIHGANCLKGYGPISENKPTTSCYTMQNLQETSSDWRKARQTRGIISSSLMTPAVKECIKGALLLHATDALMLQHVKSRQRAESRLLLLLMSETNYCAVSPIADTLAVLTDN